MKIQLCNVFPKKHFFQKNAFLGLMANPVTSLLKMDPFAAPPPRISVVPATPESSIKTSSTENRNRQDPIQCQNMNQDLNDNPISNRIEVRLQIDFFSRIQIIVPN